MLRFEKNDPKQVKNAKNGKISQIQPQFCFKQVNRYVLLYLIGCCPEINCGRNDVTTVTSRNNECQRTYKFY